MRGRIVGPEVVPGRIAAPRRLRRRLTITFILLAGVASGALAAGSFFLVERSRLDDSLARAEDDTRRNLRLVGVLPVSGGDVAFQQIVDPYAELGIPTLLFVDGREFRSNPTIRLSVPQSLRDLVRQGQIAYERVVVGDHPYLVTGAPVPAGALRAELHFLFSEQAIRRDLAELRNVLLVGWGVVVVLAGIIGWAVARRVLRPVAQASHAARSIAEGLLDTRLPVDAQDEFGAWATSFNEMAEALESKIAALVEGQARERRFTSDVAHELRTPLTAIVSEASLLKEHLEAMPEDARRAAELLVADVARLRRLVEDLMEVSRLDSGRESVQPGQVDLGSLVAATIRARGWEPNVRLETEDVVLQTDRRRLERIVANLIGNAIEHAGRGVTVRVARDATGAFVEVSDGGRGIAPEHLQHLFDRFYKADPSRTGPGSGLGLAIATENARLLGGHLEVWSELGEGTRFTLRLPVTEPLHGGEVTVSEQAHD